MTTMTSSSPTAQEMAAELEFFLKEHQRVMVAYSGGVDSTVVMAAAHHALGREALGITADTESNTGDDLKICEEIAEKHGFAYEVVQYSELAIENYSDNPINRCFFCKNELYTHLSDLAKERQFPVICDGTNADDVGDYRPGLKAVAKHMIVSPLKELGFTKADVRLIAHHYGLPNHDRPSAPCLSSRIPYGNKITEKKLKQVAEMETYLRTLGLREFRCRHHESVARLEVLPEEFALVLQHREAIQQQARSVGFHWVTLDLGGFKSGNLNRTISDHKKNEYQQNS